ncbi:MAG: NAD(P)-dependent oxidoreductase [bacterium]|nr:MAG: NAD(P)-dependent oxidoreductase [bacterium]
MGKLTVAVTGSSGFIGRALTNKIESARWDVIRLDLTQGINLSDRNQLKNVPRFDTLVHLAARSFVPASYENPHDFYSNNYLTTLNALELCRENNAKMIYISSYVYGHPQYLPIDENHPVQAFNPYADSKLMCEKLCRSYHDFFEIETIIIRPFNAYGPNQGENFLIPSILGQLKKGEIVLNDPKPKRDFIYLDDLVEFIVKAISFSDSSFEIFNVGSGKNYSVQEIVELILQNWDKPVRVQYRHVIRENEILETLADISKARDMIGWLPDTSFESGINKVMESLK